MSYFVGHEACPTCGGSDPMGRWSDGHAYCFNCGRYETGTGKERLRSFGEQLKDKEKIATCPALPIDWTATLPDLARNWINKYNISYEDTRKYCFKWSENLQLLIMPAMDRLGQIRFWQARTFHPSAFHKYMTYGRKEEFDLILGEDKSGSTIVLVEDYLSAIKVSKVTTVSPLFGSEISIVKRNRLCSQFERIILWLDFDKRASALKWKVANKPYFHGGIETVWDLRDPKECSVEEIKLKLQGV